MDTRLPPSEDFISPNQLASMVKVSRRHIDRIRKTRPVKFPVEHELSFGRSKHGNRPRFKLADVLAWIETLEIW